jgi:hypothetical protein
MDLERLRRQIVVRNCMKRTRVGFVKGGKNEIGEEKKNKGFLEFWKILLIVLLTIFISKLI